MYFRARIHTAIQYIHPSERRVHVSLSQCQSPPRIALEVRAVDGRALNHIEDGFSKTKVLVREGTERGVGDLLRLNPRQ